MAIGRGGQNIRLASMLTGYELDVYRDIKSDEEDVDIDEFSDAIPADIIQKLKDIGCDTAKAVLELQPSELARRTGLTDEQAQKITWLMEAEFEREEAAAAAAYSGDALASGEPADTADLVARPASTDEPEADSDGPPADARASVDETDTEAADEDSAQTDEPMA